MLSAVKRVWTWVSGSLPLLTCVLLVIAIGAELVRSAALLSRPAAPPPAAGRNAAGAARRAIHPLSVVIAAHLFGKSSTDAPAATVRQSAMVLTGIIALGDRGAGYAMIGEDPRHAHLLRAGAQIAAGITLQQVFGDHVVVAYGDRRETLRLPQTEERVGSQQSALTDSTARDLPISAEDVQDVMHSLGLQVSMRGRTRNGLRVASAGLGSEALSALGLYPGDMIVAVDQISWTDVDASKDGSDLEQKLLEGATDVTVNRDGRPVQVVLDSARIAKAAELYRAAVAADPDL